MTNSFKIPNVIYLQCHDDEGELFNTDGEEITWCEDDTDGHNIKFVREKQVFIISPHVLSNIITTMKHARMFISTKQKMHPTGIELYDDLIIFLKGLNGQ